MAWLTESRARSGRNCVAMNGDLLCHNDICLWKEVRMDGSFCLWIYIYFFVMHYMIKYNSDMFKCKGQKWW